jgi:AraC-like DNA-binding protein
MDRSTLGRRLAEVGSSYSRSLRETRMRLAKRLCLSDVPLEQVSEHLGFASPSTFSRWFCTGFGCSAREWRKRQRGGHVDVDEATSAPWRVDSNRQRANPGAAS